MTCVTIAASILLGLAVIAFYRYLWKADKAHAKREACRCCMAKLHKPGGVGFYPLGMGFCHKCRADILRWSR